MNDNIKKGEVYPGYKYAVMGIFLLICNICMLIVTSDDPDSFDFALKASCIGFILCTWMISLPFTVNLKYDEKGITVKRLFRKERRYNYDELGQVLPWFSRSGPSFDICKKDGRKIINLAGGYCGVYDFLMVMEEKGLASGVSNYFYDVGEEEEADDENDNELEYNYLEIPAARGVLTDYGKQYFGIAINESDRHRNKKNRCFVLYDIENNIISHFYKDVEGDEPLKDEYNFKSFPRAVSDKGAYFFCDGAFRNSIAEEFDLYAYDKGSLAELCIIHISNYFRNEEGRLWNHTFTLEDAIKINDEEILIGIARGFIDDPYFTILKYNIKKQSLFALVEKHVQTINSKYKALFDLRFTKDCGEIKIDVKCSNDHCTEAEPFRSSSWDDLRFDLVDNQLSNEYVELYRYRLEGNVLPQIESRYEPALGDDYDTFYVTNERGKKILDLAIPFHGYIVSAISTEIPILVYTKYEDENSRTYVLRYTEKGLCLVATIDTELPKHSIDNSGAIMLYENARTIVLR